ncbi:hypothetical protein [Marivirga harenae]|uniref:hypothetical protein n=1 Tax=Marivirga harenae TaxID=2010992 RepID=UPI0026DEEF32|nr:hypothetical protein [Marivirga harenae]WKV11036.1 hypothetical protein Q3Y49_12515 [Marivirga harenae]|tara:strand:- start:123605 stop:124009 length:405 start_codon:yes stop_codon:yes gene_type:complete
MKKFVSISLISIAVSILLLHSFVPHHHSSEKFDIQEIIEKEPIQSPLDLLKVGFHINLGANHLDNYQNNNSASAKHANQRSLSSNDILFFIPAITDFDFSQVGNDILTQVQVDDEVIQTLFNSSFSYRGPPSLI